MSILDTKDWRFKLVGSYEATRKPKVESCKGCGGSGQTGGGFKSLDGPETCTTCYGTGAGRDIDPLEHQPELSPALIAYLREQLRSVLDNIPACFSAQPVKDLLE